MKGRQEGSGGVNYTLHMVTYSNLAEGLRFTKQAIRMLQWAINFKFQGR